MKKRGKKLGKENFGFTYPYFCTKIKTRILLGKPWSAAGRMASWLRRAWVACLAMNKAKQRSAQHGGIWLSCMVMPALVRNPFYIKRPSGEYEWEVPEGSFL